MLIKIRNLIIPNRFGFIIHTLTNGLSLINYPLIIIFLIVGAECSLPQQKEVSKKQRELNSLRIEIESLQKEIKANEIKEKRNYELIERYNKQTHLLNKLISEFRNEVDNKDKEIINLENNVTSLEKQIQDLKSDYSKYVVAVYKKTFVNKLFYILSASNLQQAVARYKYFEIISEQWKKNLIQIEKKKTLLGNQKHRLIDEKIIKTNMIAEKEREEKVLENTISKQKSIIAKIKNDKNSLKKELDAKKRAEQQIRNLIAKLIEESLSKKKNIKKDKNSKTNTDVSQNEGGEKDFPQNFDITSKFTSFSNLKGRLSWPVNRGAIFRPFGENRNEKLNTVTLNYGIDIKVTGDLSVKSIAEGVVSVINWLPGYGSIIIITHKDEYRTVYGHLSDIFVKEGDIVKNGSVIGKIGESLDGNILHFEIWNQRNNQNPAIWLARR